MNMRFPVSVIIALILFPFSNFAQLPEETASLGALAPMPGDTVMLFADKVRLRAQPGTDSEIRATLPIGTRVEILEKTTTSLLYKGRNFTWYKVKSGDVEGFMADAFFANLLIQKRGLDFYFQHHYDTTALLTIRVQQGTKMIDELSFRPLSISYELGVMDAIRLDQVDEIIMVDYQGESCGAENGTSWVFLNNNRLYHVADLTAAGDAMEVYSESFVFPQQGEGWLEPNQIKYVQTEGFEQNPEPHYWFTTIRHERFLTWDGATLTPGDFRVKQGELAEPDQNRK